MRRDFAEMVVKACEEEEKKLKEEIDTILKEMAELRLRQGEMSPSEFKTRSDEQLSILEEKKRKLDKVVELRKHVEKLLAGGE